jgi:hypothetical protein
VSSLLVCSFSFTAAEVSAKPILIVCIGADNTVGRGIGRKHPGGVSPGRAWPAQLDKMLHAHGIDATIINAGVPHITTEGILRRLDASPGWSSSTEQKETTGSKAISTRGNLSRRLKSASMVGIFSICRLPGFGNIADAYRDPAGRHYTAAGHAHIAAYALPLVLKALGKR